MIFHQNHRQQLNGNSKNIRIIINFTVQSFAVLIFMTKKSFMKNWLEKFVLIVMLFLLPSVMFAQEKIAKSKIKKNINGVEYFVHTVQQGQTAFALAKAYSIPVEDIYTSNPGAEVKIDLEQMLFIPTKPLVKKEVTLDNNNQNLSQQKPQVLPIVEEVHIYHYTQQGETIYRLIQNYNVSEQKLYVENPELSLGLKANQWIKIKTPSNHLYMEGDSLMFYTVEAKDSFKKIADTFNIDTKSIERLNPNLKKNGFVVGEIIKLPYVRTKMELPILISEVVLPVVPNVEKKNEEGSAKSCKPIKDNKKTYKVALLMPFYADQAGAIIPTMPQTIEQADKYKAFQFIQFYEGFLIAADSLSNLGMNIELSVYDTKADSATTQHLMDKPEMKNFDLMVGPFFSYNQRIVMRKLQNTNTIVINPFSKEMNLVDNNANMFKLEPEYTTQVYAMTRYIADSLPNANILIIHNGKAEELYNVGELKKNFELVKIPTSQIRVFTYASDGLSKYTSALKKGVPNVLINVVNNEATITTFVRQMNKLVGDYNIALFGSENRWENFSMLEKEYLSNLRLLQFSSSFVNYDREDVQQFVKVFSDKYLTDPKDIAFQGFDIGFYFLNMLYHYDKNFVNCMDQENINTLHTEFEFKKQGNNAWQNTFVNIYQFDNYKLIDKKRPLLSIEK